MLKRKTCRYAFSGGLLVACMMLTGVSLPAKADTWASWRYTWGVTNDGHISCWNVSEGAFCTVSCDHCPCNECECGSPGPEPTGECLCQGDPPLCDPGGEGCSEDASGGGVYHRIWTVCHRYCLDLDCMKSKGDTAVTPPPPRFHQWAGHASGQQCPLNPDTTCDTLYRYLPKYNDTLCYRFAVSEPMQLTVILRTSTYKGIAMNAPLPSGETDVVSDMVPITADGEEQWTMDSHWYENDRSCFRLIRFLKPKDDFGNRMVGYLKIRVLDYAAEADLDFYPDKYPEQILHMPPVPRCREQFLSFADADSDGLTRWEEYRGFCDSSGAHFRLDMDTTTANTRRQIIVIDDDDILGSPYVDGFTHRLQEMLGCSLIVDCNVRTDTTRLPICPLCPDEAWNRFERLDTYQAKWSSAISAWEPNALTDPHYLYRAPADSSGLERSSDQVAIRLSMQDLSDAYGQICRIHSNEQNRDYGICGNTGIASDTPAIWEDIHGLWPHTDSTIGLIDHGSLNISVMTVCKRRNIAHELGHAISILDHNPEEAGDNKMCVMMNDIVWVIDSFHVYDPINDDARCSWWQNRYVNAFKDYPDDPRPDHKWGYQDDNFHCRGHIFYRPPFRSQN